MKREKISLFVLLLEIAVIAMLHSAKSNPPGQVTKKTGAATAVYQLQTSLPVSVIK